MRVVSLLTCLLILLQSNVFAKSTMQWRGPNRDGVYNETNLLKSWPEAGPTLVWSTEEVGMGYSSMTVVDGTVYITGSKDAQDHLTAIDSQGKILWNVPFGPMYSGDYPVARTTPTVEGDRLYVISGLGHVACIKRADGTLVWSVDGLKKFEGAYGRWGVAESPLIVANKVIYTPGGDETTMVALDKMTGETIWKSESLEDETGYSSPILINRGGRQLIVNVTGKFIFGVSASTGKILWKYNYYDVGPNTGGGGRTININTPLYHDGRIYITSGYNHTGAAFDLSEDGLSVKLAWTDETLDCHHGGVVLVDGYLYGSNWLDNNRGNWVCVDWQTGKPEYEKEWFSKGSIVYADGLLYCYEERRGNIAIVKPTPDNFEVVSSFKVPKGSGPHWAHPVISDGKLYVRHGTALMVYDIRAEGSL
jgi:outer membrane protein assembly factor BamB